MRYFATLGPNSHSVQALIELFKAGMTGIRLNLSHGDLQDANPWILSFEKAAEALKKTDYDLLLDLNGPEVRIGALKQSQLLNPDDMFLIGEQGLSVPDEVFGVLCEGDYVLLDDGRIRCVCTEVKTSSAQLRVLRGGLLSSHKSLAIEGKEINLPTLSAKDYENIAVMKNYPVTGVMLPFVRSQKDLINLRQALDAEGLTHIRIYAKIENMQGVRNLPDFIEYCDEVVIARGDLGNAMPIWELPAVQKDIAAVCRHYHKPFMVVTQLLDSMIERPSPTRAEVSDIFNAVLDGASSLMVTGETAVGKYPASVMRYLVNTGNEAIIWMKRQQKNSH